MFRLCLDLATKNLIQEKYAEDVADPDSKKKEKLNRNLAFRLHWLFEKNR